MKRRKKRRNSSMKFNILIMLVLIGLLCWITGNVLNTKIMPVAITISSIEAKNRVNKIIYKVLSEIVNANEITSNNFYYKTEDDQQMINSLAVNTILVNELCGKVAAEISKELSELQKSPIQIPMGTLSSIDIFSNLGPNYTVVLRPMGNVDVDYETAFESVGINQINFQVWLTVKTKLKIVNPLQSSDVLVERKVSLVNTVFSGKVPDAYIGGLLPATNVVK